MLDRTVRLVFPLIIVRQPEVATTPPERFTNVIILHIKSFLVEYFFQVKQNSVLNAALANRQWNQPEIEKPRNKATTDRKIGNGRLSYYGAFSQCFFMAI